MEGIISKRGFVVLAIFALLAYVSLNISMFSIQGANGKAFTLFEFFGPMAGGFLGLGGLAVVGLAKLGNALINGASLSFIDVLKLTPMMFAAYYFAKNGARRLEDKLTIAIPAICMLAFWLHPIGQQAWFYALYWLIPIAAKFLPDRLLLRSLGTTFTAHAVGSVLFLYTIPTVPALWLGLIPIVIIERGLFAAGIAASYVVFTNVLNTVDAYLGISRYVFVEKKYVVQLNKENKE